MACQPADSVPTPEPGDLEVQTLDDTHFDSSLRDGPGVMSDSVENDSSVDLDLEPSDDDRSERPDLDTEIRSAPDVRGDDAADSTGGSELEHDESRAADISNSDGDASSTTSDGYLDLFFDADLEGDSAAGDIFSYDLNLDVDAGNGPDSGTTPPLLPHCDWSDVSWGVQDWTRVGSVRPLDYVSTPRADYALIRVEGDQLVVRDFREAEQENETWHVGEEGDGVLAIGEELVAVAFVRADVPTGEAVFAFVDEEGAQFVVLSDTARSARPSAVVSGNAVAVAWTDSRFGNDEVMLGLVTENGLIDPPSRISVALGISHRPQVVAREGGVGVFWLDSRDASDRLFFRGLDEFGATHTVEQLILDRPIADYAVVWDRYAYSIIALDAETGALVFLRVSHQGESLGDLKQIAENADTLDMVESGGHTTLAWRANGEVLATLYDPGADVLGETITIDTQAAFGPLLGRSETSPSLVLAGPLPAATQIVRANCDLRLPCDVEAFEPASCGVGLCRATSSPSVCEDSRTQTCTPGAPATVEAVCDGEDEDCNGTTDDLPPFAVADQAWIQSPSVPSAPVAAWLGDDRIALGWLDQRGSGTEVHLQLFFSDGSPLGEELAISQHHGTSANLRMAAGPREIGLTWHDDSLGSKRVFVALLSEESGWSPTVVPVASTDGNQQTPDISFNGTHFGVVWRDIRGTDGNQIYFSQFSRAGSVSIAEQRLSQSETIAVSPTIASRGPGGGHAVVWRERTANNAQDLLFLSLDSEGHPESPPDWLTEGETSQLPTLVRALDGFGLAWVSLDGDTTTIQLATLSDSGEVLSRQTASLPGGTPASPALISTGGHLITVWDQDVTSLFREVWLRTYEIGADFADLPQQVSPNSWQSQSPTILFDGNQFLTLYQDYRTLEPVIWGRWGNPGGCHVIFRCRAPESLEVIDGQDNDCDGSVDNIPPSL
ncbi:MAG: hypothetical protein KC561_01470 [Myxococcales bacterium]|nr:hypothetical protein [Myxococcales bacterium]